MNLPPLEAESVHEGDWLTWDSLWELVPLQALHYYKKWHRFFVGTEEDLAQAGFVALLSLRIESGGPDRVRELPALTCLHRAMVSEIKANRRESRDAVQRLPFVDHQLNPKQVEMLSKWRWDASHAAHRPYWEMVWLAKCLEWSNEQISEYFYKKDGKYYSEDEVTKMVKLGVQRIKRKLEPSLIVDIRLLQFYK
jgi:hypothetical protein